MNSFKKTIFNLNDKETVSIIDELPLWSAPFGLKLLDSIKLKPNLNVIDIGCGLGFPLLEVAQRLGSSSKVYGIDPWNAGIKRVKTKIKILSLENVELIEGAAENIPLPDNSVDLIVSNNGINNVQNLSLVMNECNRITKKSAQFIATINLDSTMLEFYNELEYVLNEQNMTDCIEKLKKHIYEKRKPLDELIKLFEQNSFKVMNVITDSFRYKYLDATAMFKHSFIRLAFLNSWIDLVPPDLVGLIFSTVEERLNSKAKRDGEFVLTIPFALIDSVKV
ncbi:MAG: class I SAM-dependent methyltransferase [Ignavibacteriaceae bacterium]|nr:class I SAM-dependent methyltransferase [Ignavibacteriaceae bacterium]